MHLAPTVGLEPTEDCSRRFSGPFRYHYGIHRRIGSRVCSEWDGAFLFIERGGGGQLSRPVYCRRWRSLAERRGIEPLRRCRRPWLSRPAPYLLGQRSILSSLPTVKTGFHSLHIRKREPLFWSLMQESNPPFRITEPAHHHNAYQAYGALAPCAGLKGFSCLPT